MILGWRRNNSSRTCEEGGLGREYKAPVEASSNKSTYGLKLRLHEEMKKVLTIYHGFSDAEVQVFVASFQYSKN